MDRERCRWHSARKAWAGTGNPMDVVEHQIFFNITTLLNHSFFERHLGLVDNIVIQPSHASSPAPQVTIPVTSNYRLHDYSPTQTAL
jgi:hypothetical protein